MPLAVSKKVESQVQGKFKVRILNSLKSDDCSHHLTRPYYRILFSFAILSQLWHFQAS